MIESTSEKAPAETLEPDASEEAVDTLAFLLRVLGRHGFNTATTRAEHAEANLEAWARHILVGSDPPGVAGASFESAARDWKGLRQFTSERRRDEAEYVVKSSSDLRGALWTFIQGMARTVPADQRSDETMTHQLEELRTCLNSDDTTELRRIARASIDIIDGEIRDRMERNADRVESLADQVKLVSDELMEAREKLERDSLTGLYDRGAFDEYISKMTHLGLLSGQASTLLMIDVDEFKWVNDRCGPPDGDHVLNEVANSVAAGFARRGDFVARYGGAEFAVITQTLNETVDQELGEAALQRVRDLSVPIGDEQIRVTLSIGISRLRCGESTDEWLARAEGALHQAIDAGRDRLVCESELTGRDS